MPEKTNSQLVPKALRNWFIIHFMVDMVFALPLMVIPKEMLTLFGLQSVDPITARMTAAALFGIGIQSFLSRDASIDTFQNMLNLKIIWSAAVILGIVISILQGTQIHTYFAGLILALFTGFNLLWAYWRWRLSKYNKK